MLFSKIIYLLFSLTNSAEHDASDHHIILNSCSSSPIALYSYYGKEIEFLDTINIVKGTALYKIDQLETGFYKLKQDGIEFEDIILDPNESPIIKICDSIQIVSNSTENELLDSLKTEIGNKYRLISNLELIDRSRDSSYSIKISNTIDSIKNNIVDLTKRTYLSNKKSFAALSTYEYSRHILIHDSANYFKNLNYRQELIQSSLYPNIIMNYFKKFVNYDELGFKKAVDEILINFRSNDRTYHFALEFLIHLFDRVGPKMIYDYIIEKYIIDDACGNEVLLTESTINSYLKIRLGAKPDNFKINQNDFYSICQNNQYTTILFWSSHCQVCHETIPLIRNVIDQTKSQLIAISLDTEHDSTQNFDTNHNWINMCDFKGWKGEVAELFKVSKTPTLYVFNRSAEIILKDASFDKFKDFFKL